ncbi:unnamed protein product, partial [marine sediment metagenome]
RSGLKEAMKSRIALEPTWSPMNVLSTLVFAG